MATISVDVDIEDFEDDSLIEDLERRVRRGRINSDDLKEVFEVLSKTKQQHFPKKSLDDILKEEHLISVLDKYSLADLQRLLP
jgi:hypothetical protein